MMAGLNVIKPMYPMWSLCSLPTCGRENFNALFELQSSFQIFWQYK